MAIVDRRGVQVSGSGPSRPGDPNPGLAIKVPVATATTGAIALSGLQTIDGYALTDGDRVLVKDQVDARDNGIWVASTGVWTRARDADSNGEVGPGLIVYALYGSLSAGKGFQLDCTAPVVLGTTALVFTALAFPLSALELVVDGGGALLAVGPKGTIEVPFPCTLVRATLVADQIGSMVVDLWRTTFDAWPANSPAQSICGVTPPQLVGAQKYQDTTLAGWSRVLAEGDLIDLQILSVSQIFRATLSLVVTRS